MKWKAKWMVDPGDGIVSEAEFNHDSDNLVAVGADVMNDNSELGEFYSYWLIGLEVVGS